MAFKTFRKDVRRSIRHSLSRFIAIFAIVAIGAGFYAGLGATAPDMRVTADAYYDDANMMDIHLLSNLGFTQADIDAIRACEGVRSVMAGYSADFLSVIEGKEQVMRVHALPAGRSAEDDSYINRPVLVAGRMPEAPDECLLGVSKLESAGVGVGEVIRFEDKDDTLADTLRYREFRVVGMVQTPFYLSFTLGSSSIGSGTISHYMYVPEEAFCVEVYTDVYATVEGAMARNAFSQSYDDLVDPVIERIEAVGDTRAPLRYAQVYDEAQQTIADAQAELDDARVEADTELADALEELTENQRKADDGEREIRTHQQELNDAAQQIEDNNTRLRALQDEYDASYAQYAQGLEQYNAGLAQYETELAGYTQLTQLHAGYWQAYADYQAAGLPDEQIAAAPLNPADPAGMTMGAAQSTLAGGLGAADQAGQAGALAAMQQQLDGAKAQLDATAAALAGPGAQLADAKTQLDNGWYSLNTAREQLETGRQELADARAELADAKEKLADGWAEYNDAKAEADEKLADAQDELDDARAALDELDEGEWYVLSRHTNVGFASYESDADRMASLSSVLPVLFFLVAALVSLTTMTRMIEEERVIIGTYKALGYSGWRIISKYLLYALLASALGSAVGIAVSLVAFPEVCYNAYRILYAGPDLILGLNLRYVIEGAAAAIFCTLAATYAACRSSLREPTAALLLSKAPKAGKRIWLEHIGFIWKRMKFTSKLTWRNIFRYKKRLIMTLVGISGCTGLLLIGFGVRDSVSSLLPKQYDELYNYNTALTLDEEVLPPELTAILDDGDRFSDYLLTAVSAAEISANGETVQGSLCVPQGDLGAFINLRHRADKQPVEFGADSVVLTEKAAKILGVRVGDTVSVTDSKNRDAAFTVTGITENYINHYLYIAPAVYAQQMGVDPVYNQVSAVCLADSAQERQALADALLATEGVATATFTEDISAGFDDMIVALNYVVLVIIICAGGLAFVVLYNLTNINITERRRELATIKVLGFHQLEVQQYIFRETNLLTLFGSVIGLGLGKLLHAFVVSTVEVDIVMFGRDIAPLSYLISFLLTNLFSLIVNLFMKRHLAAIDMVESLKSVD